MFVKNGCPYWVIRYRRNRYLQIQKPYGPWAVGICLNLLIILGCVIWWIVK